MRLDSGSVLARTPSRVLQWHQVRRDVFRQFIIIIFFFVHTTGMWVLNSPTRGGTVPSAVEVLSLNLWTAREIPTISILMKQMKHVVG